MEFEYDSAKSKRNVEKHGISFHDAQELWAEPFVQGHARSIEEDRQMIIGELGGKLYTCIFTVRNNIVRLISARRSHKNEEAAYHAQITKEV